MSLCITCLPLRHVPEQSAAYATEARFAFDPAEGWRPVD